MKGAREYCFHASVNSLSVLFIIFLCKGCKIHVRKEKNYKPMRLVVTYNSPASP